MMKRNYSHSDNVTFRSGQPNDNAIKTSDTVL